MWIIIAAAIWLFWDIFLSPESILISQKKYWRGQTKKNLRRGKVMRPGWKYKFPDGTSAMSRTGFLEDAISNSPDHEKCVKELKHEIKAERKKKPLLFWWQI